MEHIISNLVLSTFSGGKTHGTSLCDSCCYSYQWFWHINECNRSFTIALTHYPRLHAALYKRTFTYGLAVVLRNSDHIKGKINDITFLLESSWNKRFDLLYNIIANTLFTMCWGEAWRTNTAISFICKTTLTCSSVFTGSSITRILARNRNWCC